MNQALLAKLKQSSQLPSLPSVAMKVLELARENNSDLNAIARAICNDPAISSKILRTVNSSFYGLPKQVSTISHALVILGLQSVKTLTLGFSLLTALRNAGDGFDYARYWKRSLYAAVAGRLIARRANVLQHEEAFLCGLLADLGMLVLHRTLGQEYADLVKQAEGDQDRGIQLCREKYDLDHAAVGAMMAEHWQLPPVLVKPIAQHHSPAETDPALRPLVNAVFAGMLCAEVFTNERPAPYIARARAALAECFNFDPASIEALFEEIGRDAAEVATLLNVQLDADRSYQDVLDEAREALLQLSLQTQIQAKEIRQENETLTQAAATDGLTGVANRARFTAFFEDQFGRAFRYQRPLALLFVDVDHFKKINDAHGHQAGDEVLRRLGKLLKFSVRNIDLAARYGGEEFALVLTETDTTAAALLAETIRQAVAAETVDVDGKTIRFTASVGVAGTDRRRHFTSPAQLLKAADRAMYAAKAAGRNCVRLFRPKMTEAPATPVVVRT